MLRLIFILCFFSSTYLYGQYYFPPNISDDWETTTPDELGWCTEQIDSLNQYLSSQETKGLIVLHKGKIVLEEYYNDHGRDSLWVWFSAGKSLMSVITGIAQETGLIDIQDSSQDYLGQSWSSLDDSQEKEIKIIDHLSMTTGLDFNVEDLFCTSPSCLQYLNDPGVEWFYHNATYTLIKDIIREAVGFNFNAYYNINIANKTGMSGFWFPVDFNYFFASDTRTMARFGLMMLNKGDWDDKVIIQDKQYIEQMISPSQSLNESYGLLWWLHGKNSHKIPGANITIDGSINTELKDGAYSAIGAFGQFIDIIPNRDLVVVRTGSYNSDTLVPLSFHEDFWVRLNKLICLPSSNSDIPNNFSIKITPNPAMDYINIDSKITIERIELYNSIGRLIHISLTSKSIDISNLTNGAYAVKVYTKQGQTTKKIIIAK